MLVTERPGRLRIVGSRSELSEPLAGVPPVLTRGQGGLLDVELHPQQPRVKGGNHFGSRLVFARDGTLFVTQGDRFEYRDKAQDLFSGLRMRRVTVAAMFSVSGRLRRSTGASRYLAK